MNTPSVTTSETPIMANRSHRDQFQKSAPLAITRSAAIPRLRRGDDDLIARELDVYIADAENGLRAILKVGFFLECIAGDLPHGALGPWVEAHCPNRKWRTVDRWKQVAAKLADAIGVKYDKRISLHLHEVLALPLDQVPASLRPIREKLDAEIAGTSYRQLFLKFTQSDDGKTPKLGRRKGQGGVSKLQRNTAQLLNEHARIEAVEIRALEVAEWLMQVSDDRHLGLINEQTREQLHIAIQTASGYLRNLHA